MTAFNWSLQKLLPSPLLRFESTSSPKSTSKQKHTRSWLTGRPRTSQSLLSHWPWPMSNWHPWKIVHWRCQHTLVTHKQLKEPFDLWPKPLPQSLDTRQGRDSSGKESWPGKAWRGMLQRRTFLQGWRGTLMNKLFSCLCCILISFLFCPQWLKMKFPSVVASVPH